ncbi:hypothetical protein IEQ31_09445 [Microbispora camponoti]|uniref:Uncharacterized protein n=1 Tax=Microbispora bryophytorum subsp. camponoti TaxID=1677852 RepID=A0ABR8KXE2_9ACTN|nr:hypothetical protein [Microbispora camponoti]MBD3143403.1 hypothetical protein [Microbispora camponoti]
MSEGWVQVWLPMSCPSSWIRRVSSGRLATFLPSRKKVAFALCFFSVSSSAGV